MNGKERTDEKRMVELFKINKDGSEFPLRPKNNNFPSSVESMLRHLRELNRKPIPVQMGVGGGSGFLVSYLFVKGTKALAVFLGCSLLFIQFLNYRGYLHVNKSAIERDLDEIQDQVKAQLGIRRSAVPSSKEISKFASQNVYLLTGFLGGALIGYGFA